MYIFALMRLRPWQRVALLAGVAALILGMTITLHAASPKRAHWSAKERALLRSLSLANAGPLPRDPSNRYADDSVAARFGQLLFFDTRLSSSGTVSCASCHVAEKN